LSSDLNLTGLSLIGGRTAERHDESFRAYNPADGRALEPSYLSASDAELNEAVQLAAAAAPMLAASSGA
jgi:hypothetical protein